MDIQTPVYGIYRTLAKHKIRHIIVTEDGEQVGFLSVKDLIKHPII